MKKTIIALICAALVSSLFACDAAENNDRSVREGGESDAVTTESAFFSGGAATESTGSANHSPAIEERSGDAFSSVGHSDDVSASHGIIQEESYTVTLVLNGGTIADNRTTVEVRYGEDYDLGVPVKDEEQFAGWYYGDERVDTSGVWQYRGNMTLTAKWKSSWSPIV